MDKREHASVDIDELANSLTGKFETLKSLSKDCCIYRVPPHIRLLNPSDYTPQIVSIGPIHHGKERLKAMEEHKMRYLQHFLDRTKVSIRDFIALIKNNEAKLRKCYAETFDLEGDDFVRMILVDAVFLIEYFLRGCKDNLVTDDDRVFRNPRIEIYYDLLLVENQLPLFILHDLFNLARNATYGEYDEEISLTTITRWFLEDVLSLLSIDKNLLENKYSEAEHFLDLLRLCLQPSQSTAHTEVEVPNIPSATELHQAGVKFKVGSSRNPLDITFNKGILVIPFIRVYDETERLYRNIIAFEKCHGNNLYFNSYVIMMCCLTQTVKDAELLIQNGIIELGLGNAARLSTVFRSLDKDCIQAPNFQYYDLVKNLRSYCDYPWHKWKATLKEDYFRNPWASISVIAAVILLVLTGIQTACSIIAL